MRNSWEEYIHHPISVAEENLNNITPYNLKQALVDLCHDLVEDTNISFETLQELFWDDIALAVWTISKKSPLSFIENWNYTDIEALFGLLDEWILNTQFYLSDYYQSIIRKIEKLLNSEKSGSEKEKLDSRKSLEKYRVLFLESWITPRTLELLCIYFDLYKTEKYKEQRKALNNKIAQEHEINLSDSKIEEIAILAAQCKTSDRETNLDVKKSEKHHQQNIESTRNIIIPWAEVVLWKKHPNIQALLIYTSQTTEKIVI